MWRRDKETVKAVYGEKAEFSKDKILEFPDFSLEFIGTREIATRESPVRLKMWDFVASSGLEEVKISYGTGLLFRKEFALKGKTFYMEIIYSSKFGDIGENEVVVSNKDPAKIL